MLNSHLQGVLLPALALLASETGETRLLSVAFDTVDAVIRFLSYDGRVLHEPEVNTKIPACVFRSIMRVYDAFSMRFVERLRPYP